MTTAVYIYIAYTIASIAMTVWVARTLHKNGRIFLLDAFKDKEEMADSVNHLLVVGFYLINIGFILLFLRLGTKPETLVEGIEYIATKLGVVLLVLGFMHFFNMFNFNRMRKKGRSHAVTGEVPPVITPVASSKTDEL
tara:strand:+ start:179 stop:592 length:414 start_codon:yes stop_codon:yes gene_type:complete